jgi:peptidoglycan hydrolase-like protein with peptidoglycan-binding domain
MSVDAFSGLPFQAGHAVAAAAGRTAMWAITAYLRAPLRNTAIVALTTLSAMAGSNALYKQAGHHPAPMFGSFDGKAAKAEAAPVMPVDRPAKLMALPSPETTGSVAKTVATPELVAAKPVGNEDVFEIQRKLTAFKLFDGKVDGLFGPRTSRSIRAFEEMVGRKPTGQLSPEIVALIKATPITLEPAKAETQPTIALEPAPLQQTVEEPAPAALALVEEEKSLPAPAPLAAEQVQPEAAVQVTPAVETAAPVAEEPAVQADADGIATLEMTSPPAAEANAPTKRTVQTIAVRASAPEPAVTEVVTTPIDLTKVATDPKIVGAIQRGLASLGFLHGEIDGVAGEATAKAIRNFEVYYNYNVTGRITPELVNLLVQNGAVI